MYTLMYTGNHPQNGDPLWFLSFFRARDPEILLWHPFKNPWIKATFYVIFRYIQHICVWSSTVVLEGWSLIKDDTNISSMAAMSETNLGMSYVAFCSNRISIWKRFYCGLSCGWKPQHITTYSNIFQPQQVVDTQKTAPSWVQKSSAHWEAPLDGLYFLHSFSSSQVTMFARCLLQSPLVLCGRPPCS